MTIPRSIIISLISGMTAGMMIFSPSSHAAPTEPASGGSVGGETNSVAADAVIPQSVFDLTAKNIRDPFYPDTLRRPIPALVTTNALPVVALSSLVLKALSGSAGQRLALINNRTLEVGESAEVTTANGSKIKVHCIDIKESSVFIKVESQPEPIELHLRKDF
ncbi:hypothetical protein [Pedosphaera parvula]|uniref:Uncharacterized protein n=1 Tax=Pedosphaera parvula (strain Ellin514) TaxID=320771 RepID=B9XBV6_PEDPL|nr:hypothetical protein [Pedosphaera parvula]EEF62424.1 hypothetical protein Cflav_PD5059 [Pedosphaera parvula Ellin514]